MMKAFIARDDIPALVALVLMSALSLAFFLFLWSKWTLYAVLFSCLYVPGGFRFFPWGTRKKMAFSGGVFIGYVIATAICLIRFAAN